MKNTSKYYDRLHKFLGLSIVCLAVAFIFLSIVRSVGYRGFCNHDSAVYLSVGRLINQGYAPYVEVWDHKPPLIYFITAIGYLFTPSNPLGACVVFWIIGFISALVWVDTFKVLGATVYNAIFLTLLSFSVLLFFNSQWHLMTETLSFFLSSIALNFALKSRIHQTTYYALLAGAFIALSSLSKQQMVFDAVALSVIISWPFYKDHMKRFLTAFLGGVIVYLLIIFILWVWGSLREAIYCYLFNFHYASSLAFGKITTGQSLNSVLLLFSIGLFGVFYSAYKKGAWKTPVLCALGSILWLGGAMLVATRGHQHYNIVLWSPAVFALAMGSSAFNTLIDWEKMTLPFELAHLSYSYCRRKIGIVGILAVTICLFLGMYKFWTSRHSLTAGKLPYFIEYKKKPKVFIYSSASAIYFALENITPASKYTYLVPIHYDFHRKKMLKEIKEAFENSAPNYIMINPHNDYLSKLDGANELKEYLLDYIDTHHYVKRKVTKDLIIYQNSHAEKSVEERSFLQSSKKREVLGCNVISKEILEYKVVHSEQDLSLFRPIFSATRQHFPKI